MVLFAYIFIFLIFLFYFNSLFVVPCPLHCRDVKETEVRWSHWRLVRRLVRAVFREFFVLLRGPRGVSWRTEGIFRWRLMRYWYCKRIIWKNERNTDSRYRSSFFFQIFTFFGDYLFLYDHFLLFYFLITYRWILICLIKEKQTFIHWKF